MIPFIDRFYAHMASGVPVATALRRAKLDALRGGARISDWAAFALVGDGDWMAPLVAQRFPALPWLREGGQSLRRGLVDDTTSSPSPAGAR